MSQDNKAQELKVIKLSLHNKLVGYLSGYGNGRNVLSFAGDFRNDFLRPTLTLATHADFPRADELMSKPWTRNQRLHPVLSNLLPEGVLRELISQGLKAHIDNEFQIFSYLGDDLPGALVATPMEPKDVPESILSTHGKAKAIRFESKNKQNKFSLAGVQMKFSMKEQDGRYNLTQNGILGDWIIKTPSTKHKYVPLNEFTAMSLAAIVDVAVPEIKLVELSQLNNLPQINLPNEEFAFAIKRFDRDNNARIHAEDFAQVLHKYPHEKYNSANYEQIGKVIYDFSGDGLVDIQQFVRRLLINILLANGDAHLKNWSLIYSDKVTPRLSPVYDVLTTCVYVENETEFALNLAKTKGWYAVTKEHFQYWSNKIGVPWRAIEPHIDDVMDKARTLWPQALNNLPMIDEHKDKLKSHWLKLQAGFKIEV